MNKLFNPETIALIGASEREGSVGRAIMNNLLSSKKIKVFPVNPKREKVLGVKCYPNIAKIPEKIDLSIIATPAKTVPKIVEECGKAGVHGIIIVSAGFKEIGEEGKKLEEQIKTSRQKYGMRIMGPNCIGIIRPNIGLNASFLRSNPEKGKIAFISQSGALGSAVLDWAIDTHVGFSMFVSLGSMLDVDFGDLIDFLGDDPHTRSIIIYMEGVGNAKKIMSAARCFARNKPIIVIKSGRFNESAKAALSHTGSMVGDDDVYDAAFKRAGVVRVKEVADLFNAAEVLDSKCLPKGSKLAIITNAGGPGILATDALMELGGELAQLSDDSIQKLDSCLPSYWSKSNPVDVLGDADIKRYQDAVEVCLNDPEVNGILIIYTPQGSSTPVELAEALAEIAEKTYIPVITVWMGGETVAKGREIFLKHNVPSYETPEEAVKTYMYMYHYGRNLELLYETPAELPIDQAPPKHHLKALIRRAVKEGRTILSEAESKSFLSDYGIPVAETYVAKNVEEAACRALAIGYPVVLKISSPQITHKSDIGGVITGIDSEIKLREVYCTMMSRVKDAYPNAKITGVAVEKMIEKVDYEIILGAKRDKDFGMAILFGMGGTKAEVFKDFSIALPPLNQTLARRLMEETKVYNIIQGFRGKTPADMAQLEQIIVSFSNLIVDFPEIGEIDINPIAISKGRSCALDARIIIDKNYVDCTSPYPHLVITPYPIKYIIPWKMSDGTEVLLRPIRPEDEPMEREMLRSLSEEALKFRFFQVIKNISHQMLTRFCNIDYNREMAIVAELKEKDRRRIIGIGRLIIEPDFKKGEYAVVVHDDYQRRGLGYKLVDMLIGIGQEKGLVKICGVVLSDNRGMLKISERLGFTTKHMPERIIEVELSLK
jgi:acetyltransferase